MSFPQEHPPYPQLPSLMFQKSSVPPYLVPRAFRHSPSQLAKQPYGNAHAMKPKTAAMRGRFSNVASWLHEREAAGIAAVTSGGSVAAAAINRFWKAWAAEAVCIVAAVMSGSWVARWCETRVQGGSKMPWELRLLGKNNSSFRLGTSSGLYP